MTTEALEYLMEVHYWALAELFVFAFAIYFAKSWIDYWFAKKLKKFTSATCWLALSLTSTENNTFPKLLYSKIRKCRKCHFLSKVLINTWVF